jgi:hypothetical protein
MYKECPICGRPFSALDVVLLESEVGFQCHHCWNRVHATGPVRPPAGTGLGSRKPVGATRSRTAPSRRKK